MILDYFQALLDWIRLHPEHAGWVIFLVSLAESLAIVGVLVPGVVILLGAGALIGAGVLDFWTSCAYAVAGAIIGDGLSYWLGHHFDHSTNNWRWFKLHPDHLEKAIRFFENYGDISVALGRFFGPIRAVIPLVAGLMRMPPKRFYIANVASALVWAPAYLAPGILLGESISSGDWRLVAVLAGGVALILLVWLLIHRFQRR